MIPHAQAKRGAVLQGECGDDLRDGVDTNRKDRVEFLQARYRDCGRPTAGTPTSG